LQTVVYSTSVTDIWFVEEEISLGYEKFESSLSCFFFFFEVLVYTFTSLLLYVLQKVFVSEGFILELQRWKS